MTLQPKIVSPEEWLVARKELLAREKEFTRLRDELTHLRREMPWERVEKAYTFEGPSGKEALADLFGGHSQLIAYHFDGMMVHRAARDITLLAISRAPLEEIEVYKKRMGWKFKWVSSFGSDFNFDYGVTGEVAYNYTDIKKPGDERPGASVFFKDDSINIYHTYSTYGRGLDILLGTYNFIDLTPKGRNEAGLKHGMAWVRRHDMY
jgi:predicted dithiol-disulfide oxidoreductase (DUF899 family)